MALPTKLSNEDLNVNYIDSAARLYYALFDRDPDKGGLTYWVNQKIDGMSWGEMAERFAQSQEFSEKYGNVDNEGYLKKLYQNVLNREADSGGLGYWSDKMASGMSKGDVLVEFSFSPEYKERIQSTVDAKTTEFYGGNSLDDFNGYSFTMEWLNGRTLYDVYSENGKYEVATFKFADGVVTSTPGATGEGNATVENYSVNSDGYLVMGENYIRAVHEMSSPDERIMAGWSENPANLENFNENSNTEFFFYTPSAALSFIEGQ